MKSLTALLAGAVLAVAGTSSAFAGPFTVDLSKVITGDAPGGTAPWVSLSFDPDPVTPGNVLLTINNVGLINSENVDKLWLNFDKLALGAGTLTATEVTGKVGTFDAPVLDNPAQPGGPTGTIQFHLDFDFANGGVASKVFGAGEIEKLSFHYTGGALTPDNFAILSTGNGTQYYAAAHIQNTPGQAGSGKIGGDDDNFTNTPEPATLGVLGLGAGALLLRRRRR